LCSVENAIGVLRDFSAHCPFVHGIVGESLMQKPVSPQIGL
jgi:hypothetical protein